MLGGPWVLYIFINNFSKMTWFYLMKSHLELFGSRKHCQKNVQNVGRVACYKKLKLSVNMKIWTLFLQEENTLLNVAESTQ